MKNIGAFQHFALGAGKKPANDNKRCVLYTRVSTNAQEDNTSLENQFETCKAFALRSGFEIIEVFGGKGESADLGKVRNEYDRMLRFSRKKANNIRYIVFYDYSRFSREGGKAIVEKDKLRKESIIVKSATQPIDTDNPMGVAMEDMQIMWAKVENDMRRKRCVDGTKAKLRKGYWCGWAPIGYKWVNKEMIIDPETGPHIKFAFKLKLREPEISNEEIRQRLKARGLNIYKSMVSRIFHNPLYCGLIAHSTLEGEVVEGKFTPLISQEDFLKVNNMQLSSNKHGWKQNEENDELPLKRFMVCACCKQSLTGYISNRGIYYYKCSKKACNSNKNAPQLNEMFARELEAFFIDPNDLNYICLEFRNLVLDNNQELIERVTHAESAIAELEKTIGQMEHRFFVKAEITREEMTKHKAPLEKELEELRKNLEVDRMRSSILTNGMDVVVKIAPKLAELWANSGYRNRQLIQKMLLPRGMEYDKQKDEVRSLHPSNVFGAVLKISQHLGQKVKELSRKITTEFQRVAGLGLDPPEADRRGRRCAGAYGYEPIKEKK